MRDNRPDPRVGFYDASVFAEHDSGDGHPERPERLAAVQRGVADSGARVVHLHPRPARRDELLRVHTARLVDSVAASAGRTVRFDPDTQAGPLTHDAALHAAGAVIDAVDRVLDGEIDRAFCNVRPPGHHAESDRVMGFCYFNNVAAAAARALDRGLDRVLVVDFDVHHGNGTQEIFEDEPRVLYVSSHEFPLYPGTGALHECGRGAGEGFTLNLPLPTRCGDAEYAAVYREVVLPVARSFAPQLVLVSAGYDPHVDDPLAGMAMTAAGFGELARLCLEMGEGRAVFALEGGYDLGGLREAASATVRVLGGEDIGPLAARPAAGFERVIEAYRSHHARYWPALR
jgi:acetoin utilization deacetylase AcuC-like enzyme